MTSDHFLWYPIVIRTAHTMVHAPYAYHFFPEQYLWAAMSTRDVTIVQQRGTLYVWETREAMLPHGNTALPVSCIAWDVESLAQGNTTNGPII